MRIHEGFSTRETKHERNMFLVIIRYVGIDNTFLVISRAQHAWIQSLDGSCVRHWVWIRSLDRIRRHQDCGGNRLQSNWESIVEGLWLRIAGTPLYMGLLMSFSPVPLGCNEAVAKPCGKMHTTS